MAVTTKDDYVAEAKQLVRQAHRGKPRTMALIGGLLDVCQSAEDALQTLTRPYDLGGATGDRLAQIASIFGLTRSGLPDDSFRLLIQGAIAERYCTGTLPDILRVTKTLYQAERVSADSPLSAGPLYARAGGSLALYVDGPRLPVTLFPLARRLVSACVPAGVELETISTSFNKQPILFDSTNPANQPDVGVFAALV